MTYHHSQDDKLAATCAAAVKVAFEGAPMMIGGKTIPDRPSCNHWPGQKTCGWCDLGYVPPADGVQHYRLYSQDGKLIEMTCADTKDMRRFAAWTREKDRYGEAPQ